MSDDLKTFNFCYFSFKTSVKTSFVDFVLVLPGNACNMSDDWCQIWPRTLINQFINGPESELNCAILLFWGYQKWHFQSPNWKWMVSGWGEVQSSLLTVRTNVYIRSLILSALHHHPSVAQAKLINIWFNICQNCNNSKTFPGVSLETTQGLCTGCL